MIKIQFYALFSLFLASLASSGCSAQQSAAYSLDSQNGVTESKREKQDKLSGILQSESISPYELEEYINEHDENEEGLIDFRPIWDKLQTPTDQDGAFDGFIPSYSRWHAAVIDVPVPTDQAKEIILNIRASGGADRRYLIFKRNDDASNSGEWRFSGCVDLLDSYDGPEENEYYRIESNEKAVYLVLRQHPRIGTGVSAIYEMWYRIDGDYPREVLKFPVEGARRMGNISDLEYKARVADSKLIQGHFSQQLQYKISFGACYGPEFRWLFSKYAKVTFVWDEYAGRFFVDSSKSNITQEELGTVFGSSDPEKFIHYNYDELVRLARGANDEEKAWLKHVVSELKGRSEGIALQQALQR